MTFRKNRIYWNLEEEALDRSLWRARFWKTMDMSQDILRNEYECYCGIPYFKTLL